MICRPVQIILRQISLRSTQLKQLCSWVGIENKITKIQDIKLINEHEFYQLLGIFHLMEVMNLLLDECIQLLSHLVDFLLLIMARNCFDDIITITWSFQHQQIKIKNDAVNAQWIDTKCPYYHHPGWDYDEIIQQEFTRQNGNYMQDTSSRKRVYGCSIW